MVPNRAQIAIVFGLQASGLVPAEKMRLPRSAVPIFKKAGKFRLTVEAAFRHLPTPVIGDIRDDAYHLDLRCLEAKDEAHFVAQLQHLRF